MNKRLFVLEPTNFGVSYEINPWMAGNIGKVDAGLAKYQWDCLVETLQHAGANVTVIPGHQVDGPDAVFVANAGLLHNGYFTPAVFANKERTVEEPGLLEYFKSQNYKLARLGNEKDFPHSQNLVPQLTTPWEGAGDALFSDTKEILFAGSGFRGTAESVEHLSFIMGYQYFNFVEVCALELVDPKFYHLDTCFCPLDTGYILWRPEAFSIKTYRYLLNRLGSRLIHVRTDDALKFACNAVSINEHVVIPGPISEDLRRALRHSGHIVHEVFMSEFMKAGGAAKCCTLEDYQFKIPLL